MGVISRTSFNTGDIPTAAEWNTQFDTAYNEINGNLDANNLANNAVSGVKIQDGAVSASKLATMEYVVPFSYSLPIGGTASNIRQVRFPYAGTLTKIDSKSGRTPSPQNLTINVLADSITLLNASALSMTGTSLVSKTGADLVNTTIAANSLLRLDIINYGTATGGGEDLTVNVFIDV